jgi:hypothetical protein
MDKAIAQLDRDQRVVRHFVERDPRRIGLGRRRRDFASRSRSARLRRSTRSTRSWRRQAGRSCAAWPE